VVQALQEVERVGVDLALRLRTGGERLEAALADAIQDRLGKDGTLMTGRQSCGEPLQQSSMR